MGALSVHTCRLKAVLFATTLSLIAGCSAGTVYHITGDQPRAIVFFTSPYLENRFLSFDSLRLDVIEVDAQCRVRELGSIPISRAVGQTDQHVEVTAEKRLYLRLTQRSNDLIASRSSKQRIFWFKPEVGEEYVVEHIDNPARLRYRVYRNGTASNTPEIETGSATSCE
ncbi:MAG: hypothetical protein QNK34_03165 [Woeseiaceae bacterium]|nr:hypothetical protein [Woeseiaceae bacterium]